MADQFGSLVSIWFFLLLIGGTLLINALVDLGAGPLRRWRTTRRGAAPTLRQPGPPA